MRITGEMGNLAAWEKRLFYMCSARPTLHPRALFSDVTSDYRSPAEPVPGDEVTIRLRTGRYNVDKAYLVVDNVEHVMTRVRSESMFDYYEAKINVGTDKIYYYFKVELGRTVCYYNQIGAIKDLNPYYNFQITPGFKTPEWAKGAVMYQIFVDRFYNGDKSNDVLDDEYNYIGEHVCQVKDWNKYPAQMGIREFYGGDLKGVLDKLDYLEGLGIEVIYFNPLFVSPSNHKYDIQDYDYIDPHFGVIVDDEGEVLKEGDTDNTHATRYINRVTRKSNLEASNEFFAKVVQEIHARGMKVIIDGVFNTVVRSISGWIRNTFTETVLMNMLRELSKGMKAHIIISLNFILTSGLIITHMMAGGDMILFLSLIMKDLRNLRSIFFLLEENGFLRHTMLMAGDLMWRLT